MFSRALHLTQIINRTGWISQINMKPNNCGVDSSLTGVSTNECFWMMRFLYDVSLEWFFPWTNASPGRCVPVRSIHGINMELDLQTVFGLHVHSCTHRLRPPPPPHRTHIRVRYWSAKIDDISLWPPGSIPHCGEAGLCRDRLSLDYSAETDAVRVRCE